MVQPFLISKLLLVYEGDTSGGANEIYIYSSLIVFSQLLCVLMNHSFIMSIMQVGMKMRISSCSLIYRKSLKLSKSALAETTIGQMVNLLSNDVGRFDTATHHLHFYYLAPIQTLVVMYLLYVNIGLASLSGAVFLLLSIPLQCKYLLFAVKNRGLNILILLFILQTNKKYTLNYLFMKY